MKNLYLIIFCFYSISGFSQEKSVNSGVLTEYSYQYALIEASRQKMIGNVNEAINLYLSCISANPKCDVAYYELGTVYSAIGENVKAENMLSEAFALDANNYWYGIAYSELLKQNNNNGKSLKILLKTRRLNQDNSLTVDFKISEIYSEDKKYKSALKVLNEIERNNGVSELISFKKFEIFKLQKKYSLAEDVLLKLVLQAPEIVDYQVQLAEFYSEIGDSVMALKAYEKAFEIDSSNIFAITNLADMYSSQGDDKKAFYFLNQAFLNKNISVNSKIQTMMFLNKDREMIRKNRLYIESMVDNLILQYPENKDVKTVSYDFFNGLEEHEKALHIIKNLLISEKDNYIIWQQALYSASMIEDYDEIILIGEEALKYFPNKSEFYLFVGMAYFQREKFEEAYLILKQTFNSVKKEDKIRVQFLLFLSEAAYKSNRKLESFDYYDQLIEADPSNDFTKNNYCYYMALDSVNLLKARNISYSTIQNSPENSTFLDTYAWILFKLGNFEQAKIICKKALIINSEMDSDILFHYAEILYSLKEFDLADKYYKLSGERGYDKSIIERKLKIVSQNF
jgi:tetratricopeptide (TPR) repeat protein